MSTRTSYLFGFAIIASLLLTSLYLQFFQGFEPCPLCSLQRITFAALGIVFLVGIIVHAKRIPVLMVNFFSILLTILGMVLAGRQMWLQQFPTSDGSECGVSLQYMMQVLPWHQVVQKIFQGSTECAQRGWEFLALNMAEWAFIWFALLFILSLYLLTRRD